MLDAVVTIWEDDFFYIASSTRTCFGEYLCGDQVLFLRQPKFLLIAMIDGLGHGSEAAKIALELVDYIKQQACKELNDILSKAHQVFLGQRGAALTMIKVFLNGDVEFIGLGNIQSHLLLDKDKIQLIAKDGVLGWRMYSSKLFKYSMSVNDRLIMFSDGVSQRIISEFKSTLQPWTKNKLERLMNQYAKKYDDAALLLLMKKDEKM